MAYMYSGILGGFSGRIGNIIGYMINGRQYIRLAPGKRTSPATTGQLIQREKFSMMTKLLTPLALFIKEVHKYKVRSKSAYARLFPVNYREAIAGEYPNLGIDYSKLQITSGTLYEPHSIYLRQMNEGYLDFYWRDNSNVNLYASALDRLYLAIYDVDLKCWEIKKAAALREDEYLSVDMSHHSGKTVHVYAGFISPDNRCISRSRYVGKANL